VQASAASQPIFLLIDDDHASLAALRDDLERRYGRDYRILADTSAAAGLRQLEELRAQHARIALVIADQWMPEMTGVDFLAHAQDLHPTAKRALLIDAMDQSAFPAILQATALGRIDPLKRTPHLLETSLPGVFAVGDVRHGSVKRVASAVGEGSIAISFVHEFLDGAERD
jgi:DNA-binding NarL/FixJ family response regulator